MFCPSEIHLIPHFRLSPLENQSLEVHFAFHINSILLTTYLVREGWKQPTEGLPALLLYPFLASHLHFWGLEVEVSSRFPGIKSSN